VADLPPVVRPGDTCALALVAKLRATRRSVLVAFDRLIKDTEAAAGLPSRWQRWAARSSVVLVLLGIVTASDGTPRVRRPRRRDESGLHVLPGGLS
jgi:hypothetical protein